MTSNQPTDFPLPADLPPGFWNWDRVHCPHPTAPLEHELLLQSTVEGFSRSMAEIGSSFAAISRLINCYTYLTLAPIDIGDEDPQARQERYERNVAQLMPRVGELWEQEWLPAMLPALDRARNTDYAALGDEELLSLLHKMRAEAVDRWAVHGKLNYSFFAAGRL